MASKRASAPTLSAAKRAFASGTGIRTVYSVATVQPVTVANPFPRKAPGLVKMLGFPRRAYSSQQPRGESKIWAFDDLKQHTEKADRSVVLVDVREPDELKTTGRIPHAINIPITSAPESFNLSDEDFEDRFGYPRPHKNTEVVFYCKAGVRSRAAAGLAREAGWTNVGEYPGSWKEWAAKGGPVERK